MDTRLQYPESLVQNQFLRAFVTGLRNDNIRTEIKPLPKATMSDEELLELLNKAMSDETERFSKMKKSASANKVESCKSDESAEAKTAKKENHNPILSEIRELKVQLNEVTVMKNELADLRKQMTQMNETSKAKPRVMKFGCDSCKKNNIRKCTHCFACGKSGHVRAACTSEN